MSKLIEGLASNPEVAAAYGRDEKEFFGQGWSHYAKDFQATREGHKYRLLAYNTPNHTQINWEVRVEDMPFNGAGSPEWPWREAWALFALTPGESLSLAAKLGLNISEWLNAALESCRTDTTAETMARTGNVVDAANFHANRAGD